MRSSSKLPWLFLAGMLCLQQVLQWLDTHLETRLVQRTLIDSQDIEPAALFYTELAQAYHAEHHVRRALQTENP